MGASSMNYTIGTALSRAADAGHEVEMLVGTHWVTGMVLANDGVGVVLDNGGEDHCVVRLDLVAAVRVRAEAPMRPRIPVQAIPEPDRSVVDDAVPAPPAPATSS
jgi:hypothetical protein